MVERRNLGQVLKNVGRIDEPDVNRALAHQKEHGGYFGEALVALGIVSPEELEWGLASQFDLPYIFPDPDSVDPDAAALVSPEWALAHLTMPIMKADRTLTVVVDSPIRTQSVDELQKRTSLDIELALASPGHIRELIRQVYARSTARETVDKPTPVSMAEALGLALDAAAVRFGISTRGRRSWFWFDDGGTVRRRPLDAEWQTSVGQYLTPDPLAHVGAKERDSFQVRMNRNGISGAATVRYLCDESGHEFLFQPIEEENDLHQRFTPPPAGVTAEIEMLARSGSARFIVTTEPDAFGHDILPHLPGLLLDPAWRSIYLNAREQAAADEAFSLRMPEESDRWATELETLRAFHFDVVTVDLTGNESAWASSALDVASVAFLRWGVEQDRRPAYDAGIRWELRIVQQDDGELEWALEPLRM